MKKLYSHHSGFTLIELLVVVAIIGLLLSVISVSFVQARLKSRDTKRITDVKQMKTGLELHHTVSGGYPAESVWNAAVGGTLSCSGTTILQIPRDPMPVNYAYTYTTSGSSNSGCGGTVWSDFSLRFYIENKAGYYTMDDEGIVRDSASNPVGFDTLL